MLVFLPASATYKVVGVKKFEKLQILNKKDLKLPNSSIPHLFVDRGGKITFHGPGQIIFYFLINLNKNKLSIRRLVSGIENCIVMYLKNKKINLQNTNRT